LLEGGARVVLFAPGCAVVLHVVHELGGKSGVDAAMRARSLLPKNDALAAPVAAEARKRRRSNKETPPSTTKRRCYRLRVSLTIAERGHPSGCERVKLNTGERRAVATPTNPENLPAQRKFFHLDTSIL
jgi:hypothetical protein